MTVAEKAEKIMARLETVCEAYTDPMLGILDEEDPDGEAVKQAAEDTARCIVQLSLADELRRTDAEAFVRKFAWVMKADSLDILFDYLLQEG
jgi:hypothetical protein